MDERAIIIIIKIDNNEMSKSSSKSRDKLTFQELINQFFN